MVDHPQTRQLRGAQLVEKVMAQFAALDGTQVARVHADALSEGFLGDAAGLKLGEEFIVTLTRIFVPVRVRLKKRPEVP